MHHDFMCFLPTPQIFDNKLGTLQIDELVVGLIAFNLVCAILPASGTFVPDDEVEERPAGAIQDPRISLLDPKRFFGEHAAKVLEC